MEYFDRQILAGLSKVPAPNCPGSLIVTGNSQAVFTSPNPGDNIMAACEYGKGRVFVTAHDCYLSWIHEMDRSETTRLFMRNLKAWLSGDPDLPDSKIIDLGTMVNECKSFTDYKIIKWSHGYDPVEQIQYRVLDFVRNGGGLFCGSTPWGYLQIFPNRTLQDMTLHNFLKKHFGIVFTSRNLWLPDEVDVNENRAKHSQFDMALAKITSNPLKIPKYLPTVNGGLEQLNHEGMLSNDRIHALKDMVLVECQNCGWDPIPALNRPVRSFQEKSVTNLLGRCFNFTSGEKAPGIKSFPGDFDQMPDLLENVRISLSTKFDERISTGYYLPAGVQLLVRLDSAGDSNDEFKGWSIRIGAHTDDVGGCNELSRWPCVTTVESLLGKREFNMSSPFGGLIYFESPGAGCIKATLTNVVEAPFIDVTKPETVSQWRRRRYAPGLWAELAGEHIIFTTPSDCVRHLDNPVEVLELWDKVVSTHHECRGSDVRSQRRERVVNDKQPSAGYMHSGYPIVTHLDVCQPDDKHCLFDVQKTMKNGNWGLFHEIGHNMQRGEWTFDGAGEVTVNIFSMHAFNFVIGHHVLDQEWPKNVSNDFAKYFSKQPNYQDWQNNVGMALMTFLQLIKHFGWSAMRKFMKNYEEDIKKGENLPQSNQDKIDQWVLRFSKVVRRNIKPQFEMFGLPVSAYVDEQLVDLKPWCPSEEKDPALFFSKNNLSL